MQFPVVNINGTSRSDLLEQYMTVARHLRHALEALGEASPHGRDYQTLGPEDGHTAFLRAQGEHSNRVLRIRAILADIETLAEHVI